MGSSSQYYVVELPLRIGDEESRRLSMAFEFGRTIYNATLGQALGRLTHMRQSAEWKNAFLIKKVSDRNAELKRIQKKYGLNEFGLGDMAANHRKASGKTNLIGFNEAKFIGFTVWRALERYIYAKGGRPRFKTKRRGLHSMYSCSGNGSRNLCGNHSCSLLSGKVIVSGSYKAHGLLSGSAWTGRQPETGQDLPHCPPDDELQRTVVRPACHGRSASGASCVCPEERDDRS